MDNYFSDIVAGSERYLTGNIVLVLWLTGTIEFCNICIKILHIWGSAS